MTRNTGRTATPAPGTAPAPDSGAHTAPDTTPATSDSAVTRLLAPVLPGRGGMAVLRTEIRLFRREPGSVFWVLLFPTVLLAILGSIPALREHSADLGGLRPVDAYVPVTVLLGMITGGSQSMPQLLTGYRERGILRRMSATPVRPSALLASQMVVYGGAALLSALLALTVGRTAFGVRLPRQPGGYLLALLLAVLAALALGAVISAVSRTTKVAGAVGSAVFFPMMFCAGVWLPVRAMPDTLARIVGYTPFGAAAQALDQAAAGHWPSWYHLGVMAAWTVLLTWGASRWFRWE